jgi:hypothetical protein
MSCTYEVIEKEGKVIDVMTDDTAGMRIMVLRKGAELLSLAKRNARGEWIGFLHRDGEVSTPAEGWGNHSTVMGYYVKRNVRAIVVMKFAGGRMDSFGIEYLKPPKPLKRREY